LKILALVFTETKMGIKPSCPPPLAANGLVKSFEELNILQEITGSSRDRIFVFGYYIYALKVNIMNGVTVVGDQNSQHSISRIHISLFAPKLK
jgi:hypothetical protein